MRFLKDKILLPGLLTDPSFPHGGEEGTIHIIDQIGGPQIDPGRNGRHVGGKQSGHHQAQQPRWQHFKHDADITCLSQGPTGHAPIWVGSVGKHHRSHKAH